MPFTTLVPALLLGVACGAFSASGAAQSASDREFSLSLSSPPGCPPEPELVAAIVARVPSARRVDAPSQLDFKVEIAAGGTSVLWITLPEGSSRREIQGATCEEATATLALIASLVLDARPDERLRATEVATEPPPPPKPAPPTPAAPPPRSSPPPPRRPMPQGRLRFGADVGVALESAVAPVPPLGAVLGLRALWDRQRLLSPELRAELLLTTEASRAGEVGAVDLRLLTGRASVCPLRLTLNPQVVVSTCGTLDYGELSARGNDQINGYENPMTWLAGGVAVRAELRLTRRFDLELSGSLKGLVHHDRFTVEPARQVLYDVPPVSVGFAAGGSFWL